ncbi:MAG: hypothetical protein K8Q89_09410 [Nitrosarchaeum sp.]|nr:hypothetical protein [Nitrosarchaeum sp.]
MNGHLRTCTVDGLNIGDSRFNWNDKLIIFHNKGTDNNLVNVNVILPNPYRVRNLGDSISDEEFQDQGEAFDIVAMFLACYHLTNDFNMPKIIMHTWSATDLQPFDSINDVTFSGFIPQFKSRFENVISTDLTSSALQNTKPLFEKLMNLPKKNREPISVALIVYHKARSSDEIFTQFLDLVTVLETLFTENDGETKYKLALRTCIFYENDTLKRKELFEKLRTVYRDRSDLIHGNKISLNPHSVYHKHYEFLLPIVFQILIKYIKILSNDVAKKDIVKMIDDMALGELKSEFVT